jgi:hypothetical protein
LPDEAARLILQAGHYRRPTVVCRGVWILSGGASNLGVRIVPAPDIQEQQRYREGYRADHQPS